MRMNKLTNTLQILISLAIGLSGCSEKNEPKPLTYTQLLSGTTSKTWKLTGLQIVEEGKEPQSLNINDPSDFDYCTYDDLYTFHADKERTFELKQNTIQCNADAPDLYFTDSWSIVNANATITFGIPIFGYGAYTIRRLTDKSMTLDYYLQEYNFSYRIVFTAQNN